MDKKSARRMIRQKIRALSFDQMMTETEQLHLIFRTKVESRFKGFTAKKPLLLSFVPIEGEPQLNLEDPVASNQESFEICYPRIESLQPPLMNAVKIRRDQPDVWQEFQGFQTDGFFQPLSSLDIVDPHQVQVILIPALAFNSKGYRLGRGGGFYDAFLARCPNALFVGLGYSIQRVEFHEDPWDQPMDLILYPDQIYESSDFSRKLNQVTLK